METREAWLGRAAALLAPRFEAEGKPLPEKLRVSVGWGYGKRNVLGQCWQPEASADKHHEVFIAPVNDGLAALSTLAHELCHAALPAGTGHKGPFKRLGAAIGLEGKPTEMAAGPALREELQALVEGPLGDYPGAPLKPAALAGKKQTTRLIKCQCPECGYPARITRQWIDEVGPPICPADNVQMTVAEGDKE